MNTRFATSPDSTRIAFDVTGAGTPLLLLHGGGGNRIEWHEADHVDRLKDEFTVITVDMRGHGESDKPADPASYATEKMGDDILAVADVCNLERFILCGYSFGGNVSRYLAARSDRISKLVMLGNRMGTGVSDKFRPFIFDLLARWKPVVESARGGVFDPKSLSQKDQEELQGLNFPAETLPAALAWSAAILDWGTVTPADLRCPSLWLIGSENDRALETLKEYEQELPRSKVQVRIIEGLNHEQEFNEIDQILPAILDFLRS